MCHCSFLLVVHAVVYMLQNIAGLPFVSFIIAQQQMVEHSVGPRLTRALHGFRGFFPSTKTVSDLVYKMNICENKYSHCVWYTRGGRAWVVIAGSAALGQQCAACVPFRLRVIFF